MFLPVFFPKSLPPNLELKYFQQGTLWIFLRGWITLPPMLWWTTEWSNLYRLVFMLCIRIGWFSCHNLIPFFWVSSFLKLSNLFSPFSFMLDYRTDMISYYDIVFFLMRFSPVYVTLVLMVFCNVLLKSAWKRAMNSNLFILCNNFEDLERRVREAVSSTPLTNKY